MNKNKNWAIDLNSGNRRLFYRTFSRTAFRMIVEKISLSDNVAGFELFLLYYFEK